MKKRLLSLVLALCVMLTLLPFAANAADIVASGSCGENVSYTLDSDGLLTISGMGAVTSTPWTWSDDDAERVKTVVVEDGVTSLGNSPFFACSNLTDISIADSVTEISGSAFYNCSSLKSVRLPEGVKAVSSDMFYNCASLKHIELPSSIESIEGFAFYGCDSLTSVTIPSGVSSIEYSAFPDNLSSILVVSDNPNYSSSDGVLFNKDQTELVYYPRGKATSYQIPDGVTRIGSGAFWSFAALENVSIPESVTSIGVSAFRECIGLQSIELPNGLRIIEQDAFYDCSSLKEIQIPETVTAINYRAFGFCTGLKELRIPDAVQLLSSPVLGCSNLEYFVVPEGISSVGWQYFYDCENLKTIYYPSSLKRFDSMVYSGCENLTDIYFGGSEAEWNSISFGEYAIRESNETVTIHFNHVHNWDEGVITLEPTATTEGSKLCTCTECGAQKVFAVPVTTFPDVPAGKFYTDAVLWAVSQEPQITSGYADGTFRPDNTCTRAQVVTFLWRAHGCPEPETAVNPFADVKPTDYYYKAVLWALEHNITTGKNATTFDPTGECTRAQVVTFLWRSEGSPEPESTANPFTDVPAGKYYTKAVLWALEQGITTGRTPTTFNPDGVCTRGHVVTFLYRDMA